MRYTETDWVKAAILVGQAAERVQQQRETLEENRRKGFSALLSEEALASMFDSLALLRNHLAKIEANLDREAKAARGSMPISENTVSGPCRTALTRWQGDRHPPPPPNQSTLALYSTKRA
jgi:hypothetical protein